ncbi:MAG: hypothetical protein Q8K55_07805 [Gemmatimonadaceae bacterium]|nr:hypothetical protein [Gemmatimonadaceae bacterium]
MLTMQNARPTQAEIQQQVRSAVQEAVQAAQAAQPGQPVIPLPGKAPQAPVALPPIPEGGGRWVIDKQGDRTVITTTGVPAEVVPLAGMVQETALGLLGLIAAMVILGPIVRMIARRYNRMTEIKAAGEHSQVTQQQLLQLQQSVDAMSLELERISESQRFQSKLLHEASKGVAGGQ